MNIGKQITQEEFGRLFHVTRQTVSNWENEKSYPDLQMLVDMSALDTTTRMIYLLELINLYLLNYVPWLRE